MIFRTRVGCSLTVDDDGMGRFVVMSGGGGGGDGSAAINSLGLKYALTPPPPLFSFTIVVVVVCCRGASFPFVFIGMVSNDLNVDCIGIVGNRCRLFFSMALFVKYVAVLGGVTSNSILTS